MKSRLVLDPALKKRAIGYVDEHIRIERAYIANCILTACAVVLHDNYKFGPKRIEDFAELAVKQMDEYYKLDPDIWPDLAQKDCERIGVEFDDYWIKKRDRSLGTAVSTVPANLTEDQKSYLEECRTALITDEQSKKLHDSWKVVKW